MMSVKTAWGAGTPHPAVTRSPHTGEEPGLPRPHGSNKVTTTLPLLEQCQRKLAKTEGLYKSVII